MSTMNIHTRHEINSLRQFRNNAIVIVIGAAFGVVTGILGLFYVSDIHGNRFGSTIILFILLAASARLAESAIKNIRSANKDIAYWKK